MTVRVPLFRIHAEDGRRYFCDVPSCGYSLFYEVPNTTVLKCDRCGLTARLIPGATTEWTGDLTTIHELEARPYGYQA